MHVQACKKRQNLYNEIAKYDKAFLQIDDCATKQMFELFSKPQKFMHSPGKEKIFAYKQEHVRQSKEANKRNSNNELNDCHGDYVPHLSLKNLTPFVSRKHEATNKPFSDENTTNSLGSFKIIKDLSKKAFCVDPESENGIGHL